MRDATVSHADLLACAVDAARHAGMHALSNAGRRREKLKTFQHDVKLMLDVEAQEKATEVIKSAFPSHAILGEEGPEDSVVPASSEGYEWIIDPIDGTVNFSHGLPFWCCSVAVRLGSESVAGAVFAPALGDLYTASRGGRSRLNGAEISVSDTPDAASAVVFTGLDKNPDPSVPPFAIFQRISLGVQKTRVVGSAALDMCHVACGRGDGYFETGIYLWDVAAAGLIVEMAGGRAELMARLDGRRIRYLASNGRIHDELRALIAG